MKLTTRLGLRYHFYILLLCLVSRNIAYSQISIVNQTNYSYYSPLLRLPDKSRIEQGLISISITNPMPKASLLKGLFDRRKYQLNKQTNIAFTEINQLQDFYTNSYPKISIELDIELSLFKSGKVLTGQMKYLKSSESVTSLEVLQIPPPSGSNLGNYFFVQGGADNRDSPLTILSPVTRKCREIPVQGKGDQILMSGMSMSEIFFSFSSKDQYDYTNVLREELLVPESALIRESDLDKGNPISPESLRYGLREVQLINAKALSSLYARPSTLIHLDLKNGLPYQIQFLVEGTNRKGVVLYSWFRLEDGTSVPKEISYFEDKGSGNYEIVSRLDTVGIHKSLVDAGVFRDELTNLCAGR